MLYLMHGGWSNETTYLGTPENPHELKNIIDHAIQDAPGGTFIESNNESGGNLAYRVQEGNAHDGNAALQYIYNGLVWLWSED